MPDLIKKLSASLSSLNFPMLAGPGLVLAATGIGSGDIISGTMAGANHGVDLLWAIMAAAFCKFLVSEGIARWQLATGTTLMEGWAVHLPGLLLIYFGMYLLSWTLTVTAVLTNAAGLGISNLTNGVIPQSWGGVLHSLLGCAFVLTSSYIRFDKLMKALVVVMAGTIVLCALLIVRNPLAALGGMLIPNIPDDAGITVLSLISGFGGTITLLSYSYWMREAKFSKPRQLAAVRKDIAITYVFTALFAVVIALIANQTFFLQQQPLSDARAAANLAALFRDQLGFFGSLMYSIGFWAAVVAALLGAWQSVPYLYADLYSVVMKLPPAARDKAMQTTSIPYRLGLLLVTLAPLPYAFIRRPAVLILIHTIISSLFIPFLVVTLLHVNNSVRWHNNVPRYGWISNMLLVVILALFLKIGLEGIINAWSESR